MVAGGRDWGALHHAARLTVFFALAAAVSLPFAHGAVAAGRRHRRFLVVHAPRVVGHGVPRVVVRTRTRPGRFKARLDGQDVTATFLGPAGKPRPSTLSPTDGLRRGRNRLVVVAFAHGKRHVRRLTILERSRSLPAAGRDREVWPGGRLRLNGGGSLGGRRLRYQWRIIARPKGSHARLDDADTADPRLHTDERGVYRLALAVRGPREGKAARSSSTEEPPGLVAGDDTVEVAATKTPPIGWPVKTFAVNEHPGSEDEFGVEIAGDIWENKDRSGESVQILQLKPNTLAEEENKAVQIGTSAKDMESDICGPSGLVLVSVPPTISTKFYEQYAGKIKCVATPLRKPGPSASIGMIRSEGSAMANWDGAMTGYLQKDVVPQASEKLSEAAEWFRYVPGDYLTYEDKPLPEPANGNEIVIGGPGQPADAAYKGELPAGISGFQVVAINAETAAPIESRVFATNSAAIETALRGLTEFASWLEAHKGEPGMRFFIQSIGHPAAGGAPNPEEWARVARLIGEMGGNEHIFNLVNGEYAFYGGAGMGPHEASQGFDSSTSETNKQARLHGVLARDGLYEFAPRVTDATGEADLDLMSIAYQEPQEWPIPKGKEQTAAVEWLFKERLKGHPGITSLEALRDEYWESNAISSDPSAISTELECSTVPHEETFSAAEFEAVCREIRQELNWVGDVAKFLGGPGESLTGDLEQTLMSPTTFLIAEEIKTKMSKELANYDPGDGKTVAEVLSWVSDLAWVGSELSGSEADVDGIGLLAAVSALSNDFASLRNGESPTAIDEKADDVASQFLIDTATTLRQLPHLYQIIAANYGKLKAVGEKLEPGGEWKWTEEDATQAGNGFIAASVRWAYRQLLPVKYGTEILVPHASLGDEENQSPGSYTCESYASERIEYIHAFHDAPEQSYFDHYDSPTNPNAYWIITDSGGLPPSAELAQALQEAPTRLYLPWLMEELTVQSYPSKCK